MREEDIERQLRAIDRAGEIASKSRESALKFLRDAGILDLIEEQVIIPSVDPSYIIEYDWCP